MWVLHFIANLLEFIGRFSNSLLIGILCLYLFNLSRTKFPNSNHKPNGNIVDTIHLNIMWRWQRVTNRCCSVSTLLSNVLQCRNVEVKIPTYKLITTNFKTVVHHHTHLTHTGNFTYVQKPVHWVNAKYQHHSVMSPSSRCRAHARTNSQPRLTASVHIWTISPAATRLIPRRREGQSIYLLYVTLYVRSYSNIKYTN